METVITCVYDEGALEDTPLIGAKGFSVLVDADGKRVLFDTGLRDRYLKHNLENLDIDPESISAVVISQDHPDNCRALDGFLSERKSPVDVYAPSGTYDGKKGIFSGSVGVSDENRGKMNLITDDGWIEVVPGVTITPYTDTNGYRERFLVVKGRRSNVVSGRGVGGPANVLQMHFDRYGRYPEAFIGAVLLEKKKKPVAEQYATEFSSCGVTILKLNHCTGRDGMTNLRTHLGLHGVDEFYVGSEYKA